MALNQNQFALETLKGSKIAGEVSNVMSVQFYSATASDVILPGELVVLSSATPAGEMPYVAVGADETAAYFGVVLTNPIVESFAVGEKLEIGILGSVVVCEADGALSVGAELAYDPAAKKVTALGAGEKLVGLALSKAAADGDLIRVLVKA
jgi:hypothetical protein